MLHAGSLWSAFVIAHPGNSMLGGRVPVKISHGINSHWSRLTPHSMARLLPTPTWERMRVYRSLFHVSFKSARISRSVMPSPLDLFSAASTRLSASSVVLWTCRSLARISTWEQATTGFYQFRLFFASVVLWYQGDF